jgi:hypothetical protein
MERETAPHRGRGRGVVAFLFGAGLFSPAAFGAPSAADDIVCRPAGNATDQVRVQWLDTNAGAADYDLQRALAGSGSWSTIDTLAAGSCNDDGVCVLTDANASTTDVYRYRVIAQEGGESSGPSSICREPLWLDSPASQFRIYYRIDECPSIDGRQVCTPDVDVAGQNRWAAEQGDIHEQYRSEYLGFGFNDPAVFGATKPFPIDLYPCNNGCANGDGIQIPIDKLLEGSDYDPATGNGNEFDWFIPGHELFHKVQGVHGGSADPFYKWVIEGQARAMEDKACVFGSAACQIWDDEVATFYDGDVTGYLALPEKGLQEQSYRASLFWVKVMEQLTGMIAEPELGVDVMLDFWEENEVNVGAGGGKDGIDTLNDMLANRYGGAATFQSLFETFAVANYAKDYIAPPVAPALDDLNYVDEETYPGGSYGTVKLTRSGPLMSGEVVAGTHSLDAWGARYFEVDPDPSCP